MAVTSSILFSTKPLKELLKIWFPDRKRNICQDYRVSHFFVCWYGWAKIAYIDTPLAYYRRAPWAISLGKKTKEWYKGVKTQIMQLAIYIYEINNFIMKQINHLSLKWDLSTKNWKNTLKIKFHYFRWCGQ
jgi:hypothetical protein